MEQLLPLKELTLKIKDNTYTVKFPNTGQFFRIQEIKYYLSEGQYNSLANSGYEAGYAKLLIDMTATFNVLIPTLKKDINVDSILNLSMLESRILLDVYVDSFEPWYTQWMNVITAVKATDETKVDA